MERVKSIAERSIIGKHLACKYCREEAVVKLVEGRYLVYCYSEGREYYLKEQSL